MTKLKVKDIVTVSSVRTANGRIMSRESISGRSIDPLPAKGGFWVKTTVRGDVATAGKTAMSRYLKAKAK